jgi:hypothetical protein
MKLFNFFSVSKDVNTLEELEVEKGRVQLMIMKIAAVSLGFIMISVVIMMLFALFVTNNSINNVEIFKIIGPAFSTIVGAFVGAFATMMGMRVQEFNPHLSPPPNPSTFRQSQAEFEPVDASLDENSSVA